MVMEEGRDRKEWDRLSATLSTIMNAAPFRSGRTIEPSDLNPYSIPAKPRRLMIPMESLKDIFTASKSK